MFDLKLPEIELDTTFLPDVIAGLSSSPKKLSSKYFYDAAGDKLFQQIMAVEEYYLTRAEASIFESNKSRVYDILKSEPRFRLLELGAGDGTKTSVLLEHFLQQGMQFSYSPVDISPDVLLELESNMKTRMPELHVEALAGDYFEVLKSQKFQEKMRSMVLFLGSNIGNYLKKRATDFLDSVRDNLNEGDYLMIGFDLKKDPAKILAAYNDQAGVTKSFNLNLLSRINRELGGNFNLSQWEHCPVYDPLTGECRSYLVANTATEVTLSCTGDRFHFRQWEAIFMEVSKKYDLSEIEDLAAQSGYRVVEHLMDAERLFCDSIWQAI